MSIIKGSGKVGQLMMRTATPTTDDDILAVAAFSRTSVSGRDYQMSGRFGVGNVHGLKTLNRKLVITLY